MYEFSPVFAYGLYGVICVLAALFVWKMVPETKGKTLEDMTRLWEKERRRLENLSSDQELFHIVSFDNIVRRI